MLLTTVVTSNEELKEFINNYLFEECKITTSANGIGTIVITEFEDQYFNTALSYLMEKCATHIECRNKMDLICDIVTGYSRSIVNVSED